MMKACEIQKTTVKNPGQRCKVDRCELCGKAFGMMHKQHQCKRCLRPVCNECGKDKAITYHFDPNQTHRVCSLCKAEQEQIKNQIDQFSLQFGRNSIITSKWIKYFSNGNPQLTEKNIDQKFNEQMAYIREEQPGMDPITKQVQETYGEVLIVVLLNAKMLDTLHYSQWELNYRMTKAIDRSDIVRHISEVLRVFLRQNPHLQLQTGQENDTRNTLLPLLQWSRVQYVLSKLLVSRFPTRAVPQISGNQHEVIGGGVIVPSRDIEDQLPYRSYRSGVCTQLLRYVCRLCPLKYHVPHRQFHMHVLPHRSFLAFLRGISIHFNGQYYDCEKTLVLIVSMHLNVIKSKGFDQSFLLRYILNNTQVAKIKDHFSKEDRVLKTQKSRQIHSKSEDTFLDQRAQSLLMTKQQNHFVQSTQPHDTIHKCLSLLQQFVDRKVVDSVELEHFLLRLNFQEQKQFSDLKAAIQSTKLPDISEENYNSQRPSLSDETEVQISNLKMSLEEANSNILDLQEKLALARQKLAALETTHASKMDEFEQRDYELAGQVKELERKLEVAEQRVPLNVTQAEPDRKQLESQVNDLKFQLIQTKQHYEEKLKTTAEKQQQFIKRMTLEYQEMLICPNPNEKQVEKRPPSKSMIIQQKSSDEPLYDPGEQKVTQNGGDKKDCQLF